MYVEDDRVDYLQFSLVHSSCTLILSSSSVLLLPLHFLRLMAFFITWPFLM